MSLADDGRRGADTLTALTFLTVAVTFLGVLTGVLTLRAATLRVRVLRGVATVIKWNSFVLPYYKRSWVMYYKNRYTMKQNRTSL